MFRQYRKINYGEFIVVGGDCSAGGDDRSACVFVSKNFRDVPLVYHSKSLATEMTCAVQPVLETIFDITGIKPLIALERNNGGVFEMESLGRLNRNNKYELFQMPKVGGVDAGEEKKYGWDTNTATRPEMLKELKSAIDNKLIRIYDKAIVGELYSFIISRTSSIWKAQAERKSHDDLIMALAIAWMVYLQSPAVRLRQNADNRKPLFEFQHRQEGY